MLATALLSLTAATPVPPIRTDVCVREQLASAEPRALLGYDVAQGLVIGRSRLVPWSFSTRLYPTVSLNRARGYRLAGVAGVALVNPDVEAIFGARVTSRVMSILPIGNLGVHLGAEGFYGTTDRWVAGPTAMVDLGGLLNLTIRADWDFTNQAAAAELGVAFGRLWTRAAPAPNSSVPPTPTDLGGIQRIKMSTAVRGVAGMLRDVGVAQCRAFLVTVNAFLRGPAAGPTTIAEFRAALDANGLADVNRDLPAVIPAPSPSEELIVLAAWRAAMRDAIR